MWAAELLTTITCHECDSRWWKCTSKVVWQLPQKKRVTRENEIVHTETEPSDQPKIREKGEAVVSRKF